MTEASPPLYMDAIIRPNRSLTRRGLWVVLGVLLVFNLVVAGLMLAIGAYPVPIFLGLDMIAVIVAFRVVNRRALRGERVRVDADRITVVHERPARGAALQKEVWASPTAFTRVTFEGPEDALGERAPLLSLHLSNRSVTIASALGASERERFANALKLAISDARAERRG